MRSLVIVFIALLFVGSFAYEVSIETGQAQEVVFGDQPPPPANSQLLTSEMCVMFEDYPTDGDYDLHVVYEFHGAISSLELFYPNRNNQINEFSEFFNVYTPGAVYQVHNSDGEDMNGWDSFFFQQDGVFYAQTRSQAPLANIRFISPDYPLKIVAKGPECMEKFMSVFHPPSNTPEAAVMKPLYPKVSLYVLIALFAVVFIAMCMMMCACATAAKFGLIKLGRLPSYSKRRMQEEMEEDADAEEDSFFSEEEEEEYASAPELDTQPPRPETVAVAQQQQQPMPFVPMPMPVPMASQGQQPTYPMPLYYVNHGGQWFAAVPQIPQATNENNTAAPTN